MGGSNPGGRRTDHPTSERVSPSQGSASSLERDGFSVTGSGSVPGSTPTGDLGQDGAYGRKRKRSSARAPSGPGTFEVVRRQAEAYDRFRPTYPDAVIDELLGPVPAGLDVLDVGCGTGIASRQIAQRGAKVLGVELGPRMAEIARSHGVEVEIAAFEGWDAAGRTFDRVTSAQAWHWLDLPVATAKAASVLRPGGRLGLIWNAGCQPDDLADALEGVYESVVPPGGHRLFRGYAANRPSDLRPDSTRRSTPSQRSPTSVRRQRSGSPGPGSTSGMNGWTSSSHEATTPPSNQRSETACSKPSARPSMIRAARS